MQLTDIDCHTVVSRLPKAVRVMLKVTPLFVGGGFIRATIAGEKPSDVDIFGPSKEVLEIHALNLANVTKARLHKTENAWSLFGRGIPIQFINRWLFDSPNQVIKSFDFTICQAVVFWSKDGEGEDDGQWVSHCSDEFYPDLAARRLVYTFPDRNEDAGGSMLRVRKFIKRGYGIRVESLAGVMARLHSAVADEAVGALMGSEEITREEALTKIFTGLLREVDPLIDISEYREGHNDAI